MAGEIPLPTQEYPDEFTVLYFNIYGVPANQHNILFVADRDLIVDDAWFSYGTKETTLVGLVAALTKTGGTYTKITDEVSATATLTGYPAQDWDPVTTENLVPAGTAVFLSFFIAEDEGGGDTPVPGTSTATDTQTATATGATSTVTATATATGIGGGTLLSALGPTELADVTIGIRCRTRKR